MHPKIIEYIRDRHITVIKSIDLGQLSLTKWDERDVQLLFAVLEIEPDFAVARVKDLKLNQNYLRCIVIPSSLTALDNLDLSHNLFAGIIIPSELTALNNLDLSFNELTSIIISPTLIVLNNLKFRSNELTRIIIPSTLTALSKLDLGHNKLTSITIPPTLTALKELYLDNNKLISIIIPPTLIALEILCLSCNKLINIIIPSELTALKELYLDYNQLTSIIIPRTLITLEKLTLNNNQLTSIIIPLTLIALKDLLISCNNLLSITIPSPLTVLKDRYFHYNELPSILILSRLTAPTYLDIKESLLSPMQNFILHSVINVNPISIMCENINPITHLTTEMIDYHFKNDRAFATQIRLLKPAKLKFLILQQLKDWVVADTISEKTIVDVARIIRELVSDQFQGLSASVIEPNLELDAMRTAFSIAAGGIRHQTIFKNALRTLNEFVESDAGEELIAAHKQKYDNFIKDKNEFLLKLHSVLNIVRNGTIEVLASNETGVEPTGVVATSPSEACYKTLRNILREYGVLKSSPSPNELLPIIEPLQLTRVATERRAPKASCS